MNPTRWARWTALLCAVALEGCGKSASVTDGVPECTLLRACGSTTPAPATEVPSSHRSAAQACSPTPQSAMSFAPYTATGRPCTSDSQCTSDEGWPGHCLSGACTVDDCLTDGDCADGGVCVCSSPLGNSAVQNRNYCVRGNCRVDADCGAGGYCMQSAGLCGVDGFFCHTSADTCVDATQDCGASCIGACRYFADKRAFACLAPVCGGC
jgi:hypothetical protein